MWEVMVEVGLLSFIHQANHPQGKLQTLYHDCWAMQSREEMGNSSSQSCDIVTNGGNLEGRPTMLSQGRKRNRMLNQGVDTPYKKVRLDLCRSQSGA